VCLILRRRLERAQERLRWTDHPVRQPACPSRNAPLLQQWHIKEAASYMRQSQLLTGISVVWGILELETSPRNTVDALRFERRAASYAGSAGFGGLPRSAYGNASLLPFSLSFTYAAIDEHTMTYVFGKLDFAYLQETFSRHSEIADRKWSTRQGEFRIPLSSYHPRMNIRG
jgi:hypothetical protein